LVSCGLAPNFTDVTTWLNTSQDKALTMKGLRGKVVIVDFWTYSCINCQRSLPHVEAWYKRYAPYGLEIVGVHTPEFAFEHVVSNVKAQAQALGVKYPIAVDNDYGTWNAYDNEYWPAEYLIDAQGVVRHVDFGEGNYALTESLIRKLLVAAHPGLKLPRDVRGESHAVRRDEPRVLHRLQVRPDLHGLRRGAGEERRDRVPLPDAPLVDHVGVLG